jgi:hypothetical protein
MAFGDGLRSKQEVAQGFAQNTFSFVNAAFEPLGYSILRRIDLTLPS